MRIATPAGLLRRCYSEDFEVHEISTDGARPQEAVIVASRDTGHIYDRLAAARGWASRGSGPSATEAPVPARMSATTPPTGTRVGRQVPPPPSQAEDVPPMPARPAPAPPGPTLPAEAWPTAVRGEPRHCHERDEALAREQLSEHVERKKAQRAARGKYWGRRYSLTAGPGCPSTTSLSSVPSNGSCLITRPRMESRRCSHDQPPPQRTRASRRRTPSPAGICRQSA